MCVVNENKLRTTVGVINSKNNSICESLGCYVSAGTSFTIVSSSEVSALCRAPSLCRLNFR